MESTCFLKHDNSFVSILITIKDIMVSISGFIPTTTCFRSDLTSKLVHKLAFGTPKFYIAPYDKINHGLVNMSSNCDVKSGLRVT